MNKNLYDTFEDALTELESGRKLDIILEENPELAGKFGGILEILEGSYRSAQEGIPTEVLNRSRTRILTRAMQLRQTSQSAFLRGRPTTYRLAIALVVALFILLSGSGIAVGSAGALPGDQLYPVKRAAENIRLSFTSSLEDHQAVEDRYQARRIDEVRQLLSLGRSELVQFHGRVNSREPERWEIGGIDVRQNSQTILIGDILPGMFVEVEGMTIPAGWVQASEIHLQALGFVGYVESISADIWRISGRSVLINSQTRLDPSIKVGDWVVVSAISDDFGNLTARLIEVSNLPTPIPNHTQLIKPGEVEESGDLSKMDEEGGLDDMGEPQEEIKEGDSSDPDHKDDHENQSGSEDDKPEDSHEEDDESDEHKSDENDDSDKKQEQEDEEEKENEGD
jgi:hypothetical protein